MSVGGAYSPSSMQDISSWSFDDNEIMEALKGSDWHKSTSPGKYYIKETSPVFADMSTYFSTDNFIKRIDGFEPKKQSSAQVHYGDSMKQMDIVRRQMIELTGLGFLDERVDYTTEMRNLYESGIRYGKDMKLAPGIALSQEHVDQLQDDMVWAEEIELRGTKVIIPRLYLGKSKRDQKASGLLAREIDISAGSITNTSSIVGQKVRLKAKGDIVNSDGGDIYASKALELDSVGSIRNIGSSIGSGGSGVLKAVGNIENITTSEQIGDDCNYFTKVGKMAKINMVGPLTMISMGDLINRGSAISSGDLRFAVGGNFTNESVALSEGTNASGKNYYHRTSSVAYKQGTINASGSVRGIVAGDFTLLGSRLNSGGDMSLSVGGNSYITSQVESQLVDSHSSHTTSGMFSDKKHVNSSQLLRETLSAASLTSGGKLSLDNEGDQVLVGAKLMGEKGLRLKGAKTSILASRLKEYSSEFRHDEGMWTNTTKSVGQSRGIHAHSELSDGGSGIEIESERVNIDMAAQAKPSWARHLEGRHGVVWNPLTDTNDSWHKSKTTMSAELTAVVGIAAGVATSWMGGWGMFAATPATTTVTTATAATAGNVLGAMGTAAGHSLMIGAASGGAVSVVNSGLNGRFAPDQMFAQLGKDLTSKESLKSLGLGVLTAGIGAGVGERIGGALSEKWGIATKLAPGMDVGQRIGSLATQTVINSGVRTGLAGMSGEDIGHVWKSESLLSTIALGQSAIGDIGEKQKLAEGGLGKIAMHGTLGGLYSQAMDGSFASGAIGGGISELMMPSSKLEESNHFAPVASAVASFAIGSNAKEIGMSTSVASGVIENNRRLHSKELEVLKEASIGKTPEEQVRLKETAMYMTRADQGVSHSDPQYSKIKAAVDRGKLYLLEQQQLRQVASTRGSADLFQYGIVDSISDFASSNHEVSVRAGGGMKASIGGAGIVGSIGLGAGAAVPSGGSSGVVAAAGATASFYYGKSGLEQAFGSYQHTEGSMVLRSADVPANSFAYDVHTNIGLDAAVTVGGGAVLQGLGGSVLRGIEASRALLSEGKMVLKEGVKNTVSVVSGRVDRLLQRPVVTPVVVPVPAQVVTRITPTTPASGGVGVTSPPSIVSPSTNSLWQNEGRVGRYGTLSYRDNPLIKDYLPPKHVEILSGSKVAAATITPAATPTPTLATSGTGVANPPSASVLVTDRINKAPYNPRAMEALLEQRYPGEILASSTLPKVNQKNVKLAGAKHPVSGVVFDSSGLPVFDKHVVYDTRIPFEVAAVRKPGAHKRAATRDLRGRILEGKIDPSKFTVKQLQDIHAEKPGIDKLTWHHHQDTGRMQLIPRDKHNETGHVGGMDLWFKE